eukprot:6605245-Prymnesium_polylepis.2
MRCGTEVPGAQICGGTRGASATLALGTLLTHGHKHHPPGCSKVGQGAFSDGVVLEGVDERAEEAGEEQEEIAGDHHRRVRLLDHFHQHGRGQHVARHLQEAEAEHRREDEDVNARRAVAVGVLLNNTIRAKREAHCDLDAADQVGPQQHLVPRCRVTRDPQCELGREGAQKNDPYVDPRPLGRNVQRVVVHTCRLFRSLDGVCLQRHVHAEEQDRRQRDG